jgi:hypothetical protein
MIANTMQVAQLLRGITDDTFDNNTAYFSEKQDQAGIMKKFYDAQDAYLAGELGVDDYITTITKVVEDLFSFSANAEQFADELFTKIRKLYTFDEDKELGLDTQLSFLDNLNNHSITRQ